MVKEQGELLNLLETCRELRQGALLPVLFNLALESVIRIIPQLQWMKVIHYIGVCG